MEIYLKERENEWKEIKVEYYQQWNNMWLKVTETSKDTNYKKETRSPPLFSENWP
jgi:hypothetical protein